VAAQQVHHGRAWGWTGEWCASRLMSLFIQRPPRQLDTQPFQLGRHWTWGFGTGDWGLGPSSTRRHQQRNPSFRFGQTAAARAGDMIKSSGSHVAMNDEGGRERWWGVSKDDGWRWYGSTESRRLVERREEVEVGSTIQSTQALQQVQNPATRLVTPMDDTDDRYHSTATTAQVGIRRTMISSGHDNRCSLRRSSNGSPPRDTTTAFSLYRSPRAD
jgi:hypothetical protein